MFKRNVLKKIFEHKMDEVRWQFMTLCIEELCGLYRLFITVIMVVKCSKFWWNGHVARMVKAGNVCSILLGNLLESGHFKDQEEDGKIILSWIS
jgi:hypothetical protein